MMLSSLKQAVKGSRQYLAQLFLNQPDPERLFQLHISQADLLIRKIFKSMHLDSSCVLYALGGYGKQELFPYSDLDLLLLHEPSDPKISEKIQAFVSLLWDIGFTPKLLTHTVQSCLQYASKDLTFYTSLLSLRWLTGNYPFHSALKNEIYSEEIWDEGSFIKRRIEQRQQELEKYKQLTAPIAFNIKLHPGGLRDFHLIQWLWQKKNLVAAHSSTLRHINYFSNDEILALKNNLRTLQILRFGLHFLQENDGNLLSKNLIEENSNYLNAFLNLKKNQPFSFEQIILKFEQITAENFRLIQAFCTRLYRDFSSNP